MFKLASAPGERALKAILEAKHGFLGHRTTAPLDTIVKEGLKPSSELSNINGALKHVFKRFGVDNTGDWLGKATLYDQMLDLNTKRYFLAVTNKDKPIGYKSFSKTERIRQLKEVVDTIKKNFTREHLPKVLKAMKREDMKTLTSIMLKDAVQNKTYRSVLPPKGYPADSGSANVFFTKNTILKPGAQIGEGGVIMQTDDAVRQSMNMTSDKNFEKMNTDTYKRLHPLTDVHEFSGRPKNSEVAYKLNNGVFIVPRKEWATFSKNNPNVMKVREDRARKIMINQGKPMVYSGWSE